MFSLAGGPQLHAGPPELYGGSPPAVGGEGASLQEQSRAQRQEERSRVPLTSTGSLLLAIRDTEHPFSLSLLNWVFVTSKR